MVEGATEGTETHFTALSPIGFRMLAFGIPRRFFFSPTAFIADGKGVEIISLLPPWDDFAVINT